MTTVTDAAGHTTVYGYDVRGNQQTVTDALGHTTTTSVRRAEPRRPRSRAVSGTTTITYDAAGRETSLTDPVGNRTQWAYDADDRLTTLTEPNGAHGDLGLRHGRRADRHDRSGWPADDLFVRRRRRSRPARPGSARLRPSRSPYTYDADNELTGAADSYATLTFTYDNDGRLLHGRDVRPGDRPADGDADLRLRPAGRRRPASTDSLSSQGLTTFTYDADQRMTTDRDLVRRHGRPAGRSATTAAAG